MGMQKASIVGNTGGLRADELTPGQLYQDREGDILMAVSDGRCVYLYAVQEPPAGTVDSVVGRTFGPYRPWHGTITFEPAE